MKGKLSKTIVVSLVMILVLSLGAVAAFAQEDAAPESNDTPALPGGHGFFHGRGHDGGAGDEALAEALGISVEELQAARQRAQAERLAQAVEEGLLTQDEANTMLAMQALRAYLDRETIMAEALGLTAEEFEAAREDGSLSDILANITPAELQERMQAATESAVNQAVADNVITQEQADLLAEQLESGLLGRGGFGGHHDFGGRGRGGFRGLDVVPQADPSEASFTPFGA